MRINKPGLYIERHEEQRRLLDSFNAEEPSVHIFLLSGARGTGKTVLMTSVSHKLRAEKNWLHVDLNRGLLSSASAYGRVDFSLPYFREFVLHQGDDV